MVVRRLLKLVLEPVKKKLTKVQLARPYIVDTADGRGPHEGKIAVVTGASGAIGRAIALRLSYGGAEVFALGRNKQKLEAVLAEAPNTMHAVVVDLEDDVQVRRFFDELPRADILVNCAGGSSRGKNAPTHEQTLEVVDWILRVNLRGAIACTQAASRRMVAQGSGKIISIGSVIGAHGKANFADYAAAKAGLTGFMKSAAMELGAHGIAVNIVSPGIVQRGEPTQEKLEQIASTNVMNSFGREEDISELVSFLASRHGDFITGVDIPVDGGRSLGLRGD